MSAAAPGVGEFYSVAAPAKINLFLHVTGRRADGYHTLQTAFCMLDHGDTLHLRGRIDGEICRINDVPGVPAESDLVVRAARLLKTRTGCSLGADIRVDKRLPMGGGLGGGSSDAASTLMALNHLWRLDVSRAELQAWALELGADVPFFVFGQSAIASGVGEELTALGVPPFWCVVVEPAVSVPTPEIFRDKGLTRDTEAVIISASPVGEALQQKPMQDTKWSWLVELQQRTRNDLEPVACRLYPEVQKALDALAPFSVEGVAPRMSGSGACVFLVCSTEERARQVVKELNGKWQVWCAALLDVHPLHSSVRG